MSKAIKRTGDVRSRNKIDENCYYMRNKKGGERVKLLNIMLLVFLIPLILTGCSDTTSKVLKKEPGEKVVHDKIAINPSRSYEECIELQPGMVFDYEFKASDKVNFNVHYHSAEDVYYPVSEMNVTKGKGMIDPTQLDYYTGKQEFFCLMWDNPTYNKVKVSFTCVLKDSKKESP
jgi:hypothetical protein